MEMARPCPPGSVYCLTPWHYRESVEHAVQLKRREERQEDRRLVAGRRKAGHQVPVLAERQAGPRGKKRWGWCYRNSNSPPFTIGSGTTPEGSRSARKAVLQMFCQQPGVIRQTVSRSKFTRVQRCAQREGSRYARRVLNVQFVFQKRQRVLGAVLGSGNGGWWQ